MGANLIFVFIMPRQQNQIVMNHFMTTDNTLNILPGDNAIGTPEYINSLR
jgi:hypothetical protein